VETDRERDIWAALGDGTRRAIVTRSAVSQHLKVLKDAGLVEEEAVGTRRIYRVDAAGVAALREQLDDFWNQALVGFQDVVERPKRGRT